MKIRFCQPEDVATLARLFTDTVHTVNAKDYSAEQIAAWAPDPPDIGIWRKRLEKLVVLVAEENSEIVGFATLESSGHLDHLYVHKTFQRQGAASALYRRLEEEAVTCGTRRIFTEASLTARLFFERMGFQMIARQTVERGGLSFANFRMEKFL